MKFKSKSILCVLLMISMLSACSSTTSDFSGIAMGDKHFRKANMGDSVAKVMASEKGDFVEEITADSEEGKKYFAEGAEGTVLIYEDSNVSGHKVEILYAFLEDELIGAVMAFDALYSKDLYKQLSEYFISELPESAEAPLSAAITFKEAQYWEIDDVAFEVLLSSSNIVMVEVATKRYFNQLF